MSIAIFQIIITASILVSARRGSWPLRLACLAWTLFTLAFVYTSPLAVLQLLTIWGSYYLYCPAKLIAGKNSFSPLQKVDEYASAINYKITARQFVMQAVQALETSIHTERVVVDSSLESAKRHLRHTRELLQKGPEHQALYEQACTRFTALLKPDTSKTKSLVLLPDFDAVARPKCPISALAIDEEIHYLREGRTKHLDIVRKTVLADTELQQLFENQLRKHNAEIVWMKEFCSLPPPLTTEPQRHTTQSKRIKFQDLLLAESQNRSLLKD